MNLITCQASKGAPPSIMPTNNAVAPFYGAIITVKNIRLAVVRVAPEHTWPVTGAAMLKCAQAFFPTLPIVLLSPRVGGFSRSYATFDLTQLIKHINADEIAWHACELTPPEHELPF
ncbi:hypothetical protein [Janthinobacterium sp. HLX7-2]|uniref:hypothetical protein n=1 Tax=Janthinobacterium sp. HLX7-2 TaxID=1259331 RepID=UPI003F222602